MTTITVSRDGSRFRALSAAFCIFAAASLHAGTTYYLNASEGGGDNKSWITPGNWTTYATNSLSGAIAAGGAQATAFSSEDGFVVPCYEDLRTVGSTTASCEWTGKYLQIGGVKFRKNYETAVLRLYTRGANVSVSYLNDGLILAGKGCLMPYYSSNPYHAYGFVTVTAADSRYPAEIRQNKSAYNATLYLHDKFKSAAGTYANINSATNGFNVITYDTTEYYGSLTLTNLIDTASVKFTLNTDFPGSISISTNVTLKTAANCTIGNLMVHDGATIDVTAGALNVTGTFAQPGKVRVIMPEMADPMKPQTDVLLSVPCEVDLGGFELVLADGTQFTYVELNKTTEGGITSVSAFRAGTVSLISSDNNSRSTSYPSAMTNGAQWTDGLWPTNPAIDYVVKRTSGAMNLRTYDSGTISDPNDDFVFGGHSLTIDYGILVAINRSFRSNKLIIRNGGNYYGTPNCHSSLYGPVVADSGTASFSVYSYKRLTIESEISGSGILRFCSVSGSATSESSGHYILTGLNTNFTGTAVVTIPVNTPADISTAANQKKITPRFDRNFTTLYLTDKRNLGAPLDAPNPKALTIENMSRLAITNVNSLVLDDATRGIFINWVGRFLVDAGKSLTIASPLAVYGTMWKEGEGTLVLANPAPAFGADAAGSTPDVDATNRTFRVAGGDVKIASADAVNGLDVVVENAASRIVVDLQSDNADFASFGIRNTKTLTPFAVDGDATEIPVLLYAAEPPAAEVVRGVFTVKSEAYDAVAALVEIAKPAELAGWKVSCEPRDNGDGTKTMRATVKRAGFILSIK